MKSQAKELLPFILLYIVFNNLFLFGKEWLAAYGIDHLVMIVANSLIFILNVLVYSMQRRALKNTNPNVFVRSVMAGMMIKMAVCILALIIYALAFRRTFSKMSVFASMFLYLVYLFAEVRAAGKLNKQKNG